MSIYKKFYYLGFAIYLFSFVLPAIPMFNEPVRGYYCAYWAFGSLFQFKGVTDYLFTIVSNMANILTLLVFVLQFRRPLNKLIVFQSIAFISSIYWALLDLIQENSLSNLFIGYWNWVFGILLMLIAMVAFHKHRKKLSMSSQPVTSPDPRASRPSVT